MARPVTSAALLLAALLGLATCTPAAAQSSDYHDCSCKCCDGEGCANDDWHVTTFFAGGRDKCSADACRSAVAQCKDVGSHYDTQVYATFLDCECSCCNEDTCPDMTRYLFPAGSRDRCTAAQCSSRFRNCPDPGSHNLPHSVFAKYFDCACECCDDAESCDANDFFINRFYAGSELSCTPNACRANNNKCMDVGSHNNGAQVNAVYSGADVGTLDHSCECSCCMGEAGCASGLIDFTYFADHPAACNEAQCSANFATCPDAGSHNKDAQVFATFYNCKCECCQGNNCPDFVSNVFLASSSDQCTAQHCSSRFASCPDVGSHNSDGQVRAIYNRAISTTGVASPTTTSSSDGGPLPPGAVFGIIAVAAVAVLVLVGGAIYIIRKKRQGYKWMSEDHMTNLAFDGNTNKGTEMTDSAMGGNSPDGEKVVENA
mmetsp:Transcript_10003/g.25816  ORF Transcript_10003/g.25816 Transcript_10003/m.25816 type:complete len:431 (-) Transcript_10003:278-1570(-)